MKLPHGPTAQIIAGVCVTTALPILAALALARAEALAQQEADVVALAQETIHRSDLTGEQLLVGARAIGGLSRQSACSEAGLDVMRQIDLGSTLLQAVGYMDGNIMVCSSFGGTRAFDLGPATFRSSYDALHRTHVKLPVDPTASYFAVQSGNFVGFVHKDVPLSYVDDAPGLALGIFSWSHRVPLLSRGNLDPGWFDASVGDGAVFSDRGYMIAVVRSTRADTGAVVALPLSHSSAGVVEAAMVLIPLGILVGLLLSAILIRLIRTRASMPALIKAGLKADRFTILYQPVVDLATGATVGAEILLRWKNGSDEVAPPDVFIPVAEQAGLIGLLTDRALDILAAEARDILQLAPAFHFGVNFSAQDLQRPGMPERLRQFTERAGIRPENLLLEATERSFLDVDLMRGVLRELHATGIGVAIDDFGSGYSNLGYLAQLDVDYLKIDRLFVQSLGTDAATSQVASRIIDMARDLGIKTVAEGVESQRQAHLLRELRVDFAQGFLFARPMTIDELIEHLRKERSGAGTASRDLAA